MYYIHDPPFLLRAILETALTHLRILMIKVNTKVQVTMGIIIEVYFEVDLIYIKDEKEKEDLVTKDLVEVK